MSEVAKPSMMDVLKENPMLAILLIAGLVAIAWLVYEKLIKKEDTTGTTNNTGASYSRVTAAAPVPTVNGVRQFV